MGSTTRPRCAARKRNRKRNPCLTGGVGNTSEVTGRAWMRGDKDQRLASGPGENYGGRFLRRARQRSLDRAAFARSWEMTMRARTAALQGGRSRMASGPRVSARQPASWAARGAEKGWAGSGRLGPGAVYSIFLLFSFSFHLNHQFELGSCYEIQL